MQFWKNTEEKIFLSFSSVLYPVANMIISVVRRCEASSFLSSWSTSSPFLQKLNFVDFLRTKLPSFTWSKKLGGVTGVLHEYICSANPWVGTMLYFFKGYTSLRKISTHFENIHSCTQWQKKEKFSARTLNEIIR